MKEDRCTNQGHERGQIGSPPVETLGGVDGDVVWAVKRLAKVGLGWGEVSV